MNRSLYNYIRPLLISALVGSILSGFYLVWLMNESPVQGIGLLFIILYLWIFFTIAVYLFWTRLLVRWLTPYSTRWKVLWAAGCLTAGLWLADNIPVVLPGSGIFKALLFLFAGAGLAILLFVVMAWLVTRSRPANPPVKRRFGWLIFALPMMTAWVMYLLAFWPGLMSADSLNQWGQMISGQVNDHHPAFHTFTIWLTTRIAETPAVVALAQIIALALVVGMILAWIESLGVASFWVWAASVLFAISPVNGTMVNTLWKDIPYSTVMLAFTYLIFRMASSHGDWIAMRGRWLLLGTAAALAPLFRHNGLQVVLITIPVLIVAFRRFWKPIGLAFAVTAALYFGITGPGYRLAGVERSTVLIEAASSLYTTAAGADADSRTEAALLSMNPLSNDWQCSVLTSLYQAKQMDGAGFQETPVQKAQNLIRFAPSLLAYDYRCNRSLVWIIWDPNGEVRNPSHAEYGIDPNAFGLKTDSKIPYLNTIMTKIVVRTAYDPAINWLVWRPALYLYAFLLIVTIFAMRQKNLWYLVTAVPVLLQSISMTLITMPPNLRYHYFVYILALAFWPILFSPYHATEGVRPSSLPQQPITE